MRHSLRYLKGKNPGLSPDWFKCLVSWESKGPTSPMLRFPQEITGLRRLLRDNDGIHNPLIRPNFLGGGIGGGPGPLNPHDGTTVLSIWEKYGQVRYFYLNPKDFGGGPLMNKKKSFCGLGEVKFQDTVHKSEK